MESVEYALSMLWQNQDVVEMNIFTKDMLHSRNFYVQHFFGRLRSFFSDTTMLRSLSLTTVIINQDTGNIVDSSNEPQWLGSLSLYLFQSLVENTSLTHFQSDFVYQRNGAVWHNIIEDNQSIECIEMTVLDTMGMSNGDWWDAFAANCSLGELILYMDTYCKIIPILESLEQHNANWERFPRVNVNLVISTNGPIHHGMINLAQLLVCWKGPLFCAKKTHSRLSLFKHDRNRALVPSLAPIVLSRSSSPIVSSRHLYRSLKFDLHWHISNSFYATTEANKKSKKDDVVLNDTVTQHTWRVYLCPLFSRISMPL